MPIINAASSIWLTGQVWLPDKGIAYVPFSNFTCRQISDRNSATDITYGAPYEKIWDVGNTYWQIDFSCPIIVPENGYIPSVPYYNPMQHIDSYLKYLLSISGFKGGDAFSPYTLKDKWDFSKTELISSNNVDFIVSKFALNISENESTFSVSIISTTDLRDTFKVFSKNDLTLQTPFLDNTVYRTVQPFDLEIPSGCIGSKLGFQQATKKHWPVQSLDDTNYTNFVREYSLSLEANTTQVPSIGIPSSRAFLGVTSVKSSGNIKYVPIYKTSGDIYFQEPSSSFCPAGWVVDTQSVDYISNTLRHGGRLYVSLDTATPIYVKSKIKNWTEYLIDGTNSSTQLGPVSTSSWTMNISGGQFNSFEIDFVTSPGITSF